MTKPPEPELSALQRVQKIGRDKVEAAADLLVDATQQVTAGLREADNNLGITERVKGIGADVDRRLHLSDKAGDVWQAVSQVVEDVAASAKRRADEGGITAFVTEQVVSPINCAAHPLASSDTGRKVLGATEDAYGSVRRTFLRIVAPQLPTYDSYALLQVTKRELNYIAACILHVSPEASSQLGTQFSRALTAKVAGAASTTALLTLVAAFGHAGTGTAIAGLSGAAATSATMAWVGGLVGGGVAAGAALTGGVALVVGLATYKMLASERRAFESLSELEQRIVQSCWMLAAVADVYQKRPSEFTFEAASAFLDKMLVPLHRDIAANMEDLCRPLDTKNAIAMRQHVLGDFQSAVINRLCRYLSWAHSDAGRTWHASLVAADAAKPSSDERTLGAPDDVLAELRSGEVEAAVGGVFAALLTREPIEDSTESRLVMDALRRSTLELRDGSEDQLGDYLRLQSPEGLRGVAANVKGIYHELWYVEQYNASHEDTHARTFEATNHPGLDVQIVDADTGQVVREIQLKAVESPASVNGHFERYPHFDVVSTDEVAAMLQDPRVDASGITNAKLEGDVVTRLDTLRDDTVASRSADTALLALGIASCAEVMQMLRGERSFPEALMNTAAKTGAAAGATALTAMLFG